MQAQCKVGTHRPAATRRRDDTPRHARRGGPRLGDRRLPVRGAGAAGPAAAATVGPADTLAKWLDTHPPELPAVVVVRADATRSGRTGVGGLDELTVVIIDEGSRASTRRSFLGFMVAVLGCRHARQAAHAGVAPSERIGSPVRPLVLAGIPGGAVAGARVAVPVGPLT